MPIIGVGLAWAGGAARVVSRVRGRVRTLDAIHLATAVLARSLGPDLAVLSLAERFRRSAEQMGFRALPGDAA